MATPTAPLDAAGRLAVSRADAFARRHGVEVAHLDQYFGPWAADGRWLRAIAEGLSGTDLAAHLQQARRGESRLGPAVYQVTPEGVALIDVAGPMMKFVGSLQDGTSTVEVRRQMRAAAGDEVVRAILLRIDSPGGTVAGTYDLADDVAAAARRKPVVAYVEDRGASAAYAVGSQATAIYANPTALVGSIGTYAVVHDESARAARLGVKVHVIRAGEHKGAGTPGTPITTEQLDEWQRVVDALNEHFVATVARGRRLPVGRVRDLADGRVHPAEEALRLGLIDGVRAFDETLDRLLAGEKPQPRSETPMQPTIDQLTEACPGASDAFLVRMLREGHSLDEARTLHAREQAAELQRVRHAAAASAAPLRAVPTAAAGASGAGVPAELDELVRERMAAGMTRHRAILAACKARPDLHEEALRTANKPSAEAFVRDRFA